MLWHLESILWLVIWTNAACPTSWKLPKTPASSITQSYILPTSLFWSRSTYRKISLTRNGSTFSAGPSKHWLSRPIVNWTWWSKPAFTAIDLIWPRPGADFGIIAPEEATSCENDYGVKGGRSCFSYPFSFCLENYLQLGTFFPPSTSLKQWPIPHWELQVGNLH